MSSNGGSLLLKCSRGVERRSCGPGRESGANEKMCDSTNESDLSTLQLGLSIIIRHLLMCTFKWKRAARNKLHSLMNLEEGEPDDILLSHQHFPEAGTRDGRTASNWLRNAT